MSNKHSLLYLTDFYYPAKGRKYYEEDLYIISQLKDEFEILISFPKNSKKYEELVDLVIFRNTGSVIYYKQHFEAFVARVNSRKLKTYNEMTGKGDMSGKQYLVDLTLQQYPVIPTIDALSDLKILPNANKYVLKLKDGADSIGMKSITYNELLNEDIQNYIIQPYIDFIYEVSFYFIDHEFQYALYAPDKSKRWKLEIYAPTEQDIAFALKFIKWNTINHGIQRIDACRVQDGNLLLVEIEDLNPFLSLDKLNKAERQNFISAFKKSIVSVIKNKKVQNGI